MDVDARVGDAHHLDFDDGAFDAVLLHLILTVVPDPDAVAAEAARVLAADGRVSIYDKFVPPGKPPSLQRRALNPLARFLFSDLTRRLEPMIEGTGLTLGRRDSFLGGLYTVTVARPVPDR
jgi:ubiquinone/menaquinone biosynthesis C-methylase UbiE